jgi:hypothetical protein
MIDNFSVTKLSKKKYFLLFIIYYLLFICYSIFYFPVITQYPRIFEFGTNFFQ